MLKPEDKAFYARQGYLVLPGFKAAAELAALRARAIQIVDHFEPGEPGPGAVSFSTVDASVKEDAWFLASGDSVRCFLEEDALDAQGRLTRPSALAVNKIGHALHDLRPGLRPLSRTGRRWRAGRRPRSGAAACWCSRC